MRFIISLLALSVAAKAAVIVPLESRADIKCSTDDGNGICVQDESTCKGSVVDDGCSTAGYSCCVPPDADDKEDDVDTDEGDEGVGPDDGDHIPDDDDNEPAITARDVSPLLVPRKDTCGVKVYKFALKQRGVPYKWGGGDCNGPTKGGFDCSGLTKYAVCKATSKKKVLPHSAWKQYKSKKCKHIRYANRQKGDLVFWSTKKSGKCTKDSSIKHVAVVQNDKYIIVAPKAGQKVKRQKMWSGHGGLYRCNYVARCC
ncbi:hypothetical protein J3E72DRAFT_270982 [Bipolaris maydis]|nr:hypothetical protein BM1_07340 [Bipolaris maydis]KAJ6195899.1 hypothetical protein J3E72DRAFT_270982 [Bipolaris maydis]KAJ6269378.1 hypothetical protein PSV08DRAFT_372797 [Bipolaris maydis]